MYQKKKVYLKLIVPQGDYCWCHITGVICEHFKHKKGCDIGMIGQKENDCGVLKPNKCRGLRTL